MHHYSDALYMTTVSYLYYIKDIHWSENVILMKFSSLAVLEVVILTTSSAANYENFIKIKTFLFQQNSHKGIMIIILQPQIVNNQCL